MLHQLAVDSPLSGTTGVIAFEPEVSTGVIAFDANVSHATYHGLVALFRTVFGSYSEAMFEELVADSPLDLVQLLDDSSVPDTRLTFAAEILGRNSSEAIAVAPLIRLLGGHRSPLVREGAVLGLAYHLGRGNARAAIERAADRDPSPGVRRAASEVLEG